MTRGLQSRSRLFEPVIACKLQAAVTVVRCCGQRELWSSVALDVERLHSAKQGVCPCVIKKMKTRKIVFSQERLFFFVTLES
jgi:hypothetical protein